MAKKTKPKSGVGRKCVKRVRGHKPRATNKIPAQQGISRKHTKVGYKRPPEEHRFAPGQSGNPAGAPKARTNLWRYFCEFVGLAEKEVAAIQKDRAQPLARRTAAKQALQLWKKGLIGVGLPFTMYAINRDEGKPTERVEMQAVDVLSAEECEEIRKAMRK